jgi:hypothetical protein
MQKYIYKKLPNYSILLLALVLFSCSDIIEKNLDNESVVLIAPGNGLNTTIATNQYIWNALDGALEYNMQIATPDFNQVQRMILDTTLSLNKFNFTLSPGSYEWRVKALNGSSETPYSSFLLVIDSTADLSSMPLILISPPNLAVTSNTLIEYRWYGIEIAEGYRLEITNSDGLNEIFIDQTFTDDVVPIQMEEGNYDWRVYASNSTPSVSNWSETRTITIDLTPPTTPILNYPTVSSTVQDTIFEFLFQSGIDNLTETYDSLWVSTNVLFASPIRQVKIESNQSYSDSLGIGTYYWRVKTIDLAGNGTMSSVYAFHVE